MTMALSANCTASCCRREASKLCITIVLVGWSQLPCSSSVIIILLTRLYTVFSGSSNILQS